MYTVNEFCQHVSEDVNMFIRNMLAPMTHRNMSDKEKRELSDSYIEVSKMLQDTIKKNPKIGNVHISTTNLLLEYQLPGASAWCDLVLLGKGHEKNQVVIVELKNFESNSHDNPGLYEGTIIHDGREQLHPSDQVKGYTDYCQFFHSEVLQREAVVSGCVFISSSLDIKPFTDKPNDNLTAEHPVYNTNTTSELSDYITSRIEKPDKEFAVKFVNGYYKQNRNILKQVGETLQEASIFDNARPFVLVEEQREGYNFAREAVKRAYENKQKEVIIIQGAPGSGKSAVAINLWIDAAIEYEGGNVVYVTTGASQNSNWEKIFKSYAKQRGIRAAEGFLYKSTKFNPGLQGGTKNDILAPLVKAHPEYLFEKKYGDKTHRYDCFREYLDFMLKNKLTKNYKPNLHLLSVVDEAHALINPLVKNYSANTMAGWCLQAGPQGWHIINESLVSVFLMDTNQSFRDNETTSIEDLEEWAKELGAKVTKISLDKLQFRCAGSIEYVEWVTKMFSNNPISNHSEWKDRFLLELVDSPAELEAKLNEKRNEDSNNLVRLLSSYSRPWVSKDKIDLMHHKKDVPFDFELENPDGSIFQKYWNVSHAAYIQAPENSAMYADPLSEVGCPYTVRGFDFEYVGILWLEDIVRRNGKWVINRTYAVESGLQSKANAAFAELKAINRRLPRTLRKKQNELCEMVVNLSNINSAITVYFEKIAQAYRILLTRGIKGVFLYVKDPETREYVKSLL